MDPNKQRIAIAAACGWKWKKENVYLDDPRDDRDAPKWFRITDPDGREHCEYCIESSVPDYLHDLNAMHEAEKVLTDDQTKRYIETLCKQVHRQPGNQWGVMATAAQRAEAFLRTIGKWEE